MHHLPRFLGAGAAKAAYTTTQAQHTATITTPRGGPGGAGPRTLAAAAGKGALAAMARGFAESLAAHRIRVFALLLDDEPASVAAPPSEVARAIAELAVGNAPTPSGSIIELAQARAPATVNA